MESKYTAGQWELRGNKIFVSGTYNSIATVHIQKSWDEQINPIEDTEAIANTKLIAAAPELLEALLEAKEVSLQLDHRHNGKCYNPGSENCNCTLCKIESVIKKALQ